MESHEWFDNTDEGKVYYRGNFLGGRWTIMTTTQKRDPVWTDVSPVTEALWRELRDIVWKKYQRKRCPWERVAELDKILGGEPPSSEAPPQTPEARGQRPDEDQTKTRRRT